MRILLVLAIAASATGCATVFSPGVIRGEISRQTGADPQRAVEFTLGPTTLSLARAVLRPAAAEGARLPLAGLNRFELAVYDMRVGSEAPAAGVDFTRMKITGWETTMRSWDGKRSVLVLVRGQRADRLADVVLVSGGERQVLYARLRGTLNRSLPEELARAAVGGNTDAVRDELLSLTPPEP
ncbi:MAG: hypothetical protein KBD01_11915 [Acidobacteria bacterium]|nr:hypothetical protein [Acidobacteriota bacterium]